MSNFGDHQILRRLVWNTFYLPTYTFIIFVPNIFKRGVELGHNSGFVNGNMRLLITANEWGRRRRGVGGGDGDAANDFIEEVIVAPSHFRTIEFIS